MKLLVTVLLAVSMVGVAEGQDRRMEKPEAPDASWLKAPVGMLPMLEARTQEDRPGLASQDATQRYAEALAAYAGRLKGYAGVPMPKSAGPTGIDCAMIHWADTTAASIPTRTPPPGVDVRMPVLAPKVGCVPPEVRAEPAGH